MNPLFDMLTGMQNNAAAQQIGKQFGLQADQVNRAMEALLPAFSQGLRRNAGTPAGFADFMAALARGNHGQYAADPMKAFSPEGISEGNGILGHLFGSKEVSRAIARQAEATIGVSAAILKQMLPVLAPLIMGGIFNQMTGQATGSQAAQAMGSGNPWGRILEEMMKGGFGGGSAQSRPVNPLEEILKQMTGGRGMPGQQSPGGGQGRARNPLEEILEQMTGGRGMPGQQPAGGRQGNSPSGDNPLGEIFKDMLGGRSGEAQPRPAPREDPYSRQGQAPRMGEEDEGLFPDFRDGRVRDGESAETPSEKPRGGGLEDLFGEMFDTGRKVNKQYQDSIESIFDEFLGPRRK